tara:strand:- start:137 stop:301 length:165 start_codon:yes stop_codon:yes gene_type:complete
MEVLVVDLLELHHTPEGIIFAYLQHREQLVEHVTMEILVVMDLMQVEAVVVPDL